MDYTKKILYQSNYWYNDGLRKAQVRDMTGAIISLRQSLQYNRENIAARNLLGLVYYGIGEVAEALVEWIISKNLKPRDNIADYYIKNVQASANELETINQAVKKFNQCLAYCQQNGEDLAMIQLKQVVAAHPTYLKAYQLLALVYIHANQNSKARQMLLAARKLDVNNETTLRFLREITRQRGRHGKNVDRKRKKDETVEYSLGNETIIQPKHSIIREVSGHLALPNLFIGAVIGAAIIWFLVAPAVNQNRSDKLNSQMREYSSQINTLEAQVSAQTRTLDQYRAASDAAEDDAAQSQTVSESYENLMTVSDQQNSGEYSDSTMADTLLQVNRDQLGDQGKALYDELTDSIFPNACSRKLSSASDSIDSEDYDSAIEELLKVIKMDEGYNDAQALYLLAQAYEANGDTDNAKKYYQKIVDEYSDSQYDSDASDKLDALKSGTSSDSKSSDNSSGDSSSGDSSSDTTSSDNGDNSDNGGDNSYTGDTAGDGEE